MFFSFAASSYLHSAYCIMPCTSVGCVHVFYWTVTYSPGQPRASGTIKGQTSLISILSTGIQVYTMGNPTYS